MTFYRFIPTARCPIRADRSGCGSLPTRAFRYCEPATSAAAFGWYVFSPINFSVQWDGNDMIWTWEGAGRWYPLKVAQFPGFRDQFYALAPEESRDFSPPFLVALQEPGLLQMWTGLVLRTRPGWSSLVRAPANVPRSSSYEVYEGIIETDHWFGPLITNIRITKTGIPVDFLMDRPLLQVQPIPYAVYSDETLNDCRMVLDISGLQRRDWDRFYDTVVRPQCQVYRHQGQYAAVIRKRRAREKEAFKNKSREPGSSPGAPEAGRS
jgi:hypothetical protein